MAREHHYKISIHWTGNKGDGTSDYRTYGRDHVLRIDGKPDIPCSSDPGFFGDPSRYNPEELLVAALSACHMLWYLRLCADRGIVITGYYDGASGTMEEHPAGGGHFKSVVLNPHITIMSGDLKIAEELHAEANKKCFIANSVNFPVRHLVTLERASSPGGILRP